jgi:putative phosphonate catabolism associated alcohol dehydrogenase
MKTSKTAIFTLPNAPLTTEAVEIPPLKEGEILVRNEYTTLCRSDLHTFSGKRTEKTPTILGHEIVGVIEEFGPGAPTHDTRGDPLSVGDRLTWAIYAANPESAMARRGIPQKGNDLFKYGHEAITPDSHLHGGLSEYCILRRYTPILKLREPIPLQVIALINCSVATVAGSLRLAGVVEDRNVMITGAGMLGIIACAMGRARGARRVIAVDISEERLATAKDFGVDDTILLEPGGSPLKDLVTEKLGEDSLDTALDYSGSPEAMEASLEALGIGGTAVWVGAVTPQRAVAVSAERTVRNLHVIKGLHNYNQEDFVAAVEFMEQHYSDFPFIDLVQDRFDLDSVDEAFASALSSGAHRVGVRTVSKS